MFFWFLLRAPQETIKQPPPKEPTRPKVFGPHGPREYTPESTSAPTELLPPLTEESDTLEDNEELLLTGMSAMPEVPEKCRPLFDQFQTAIDEWLTAHLPPVDVIEWRSPSRPLKAEDAKHMDMAGAVPFLYSKIRSVAETFSKIEGLLARSAHVSQETRELLQHQIQATANSIDTILGNLPTMPKNLQGKAQAVAQRAQEIINQINIFDQPLNQQQTAA